MKGLKIGHATNTQRQTGASIFIFENPAVGAYHLCGASPASHELNTLELDANVTQVNALAFLGGSAFGLNAVAGAMQWLKERHQGWPTAHGCVPIVPAAAIYDFALGEALPPTQEEVYAACELATENNVAAGRVGAGTGASIGKLAAHASRMTGGIGCAEIFLPDGVSVLVYAVINSVGDVRDREGKIIAGARQSNGEFVDCEKFLLAGNDEKVLLCANTTLIAIFTNAAFSKIELKRIAKMAVAGMGRAISPIFTRYDGDIIFSFSLGNKKASELVVGTLAASVTHLAIMDAVKDSISL